MATSSYEPTVHSHTPMPKGYTFVRKGNIYITKNCRKLTSEANKTVYIVEDDNKKQLGIRVPQHIYQQVRKANLETKDARAEAVQKKDLALETKVKSEVLRLYPKIPAREVESVLKHTLKKRSGRVGRSKDMDVKEMVELAVRAHIRHTQTQYDSMLRRGVNREKARECIHGVVEGKIEEWGGKRKGGSAKKSRMTERSKLKQTQRTARKGITKRGPKGLDKRDGSGSGSCTESAPRMGLLRRSSLRLRAVQARDESEELDFMELD